MKAAYCLIYSIADNLENIHSLIGFGQPSINLIDALKCSVRRYCIDATAHLTCYLMPYRNVLWQMISGLYCRYIPTIQIPSGSAADDRAAHYRMAMQQNLACIAQDISDQFTLSECVSCPCIASRSVRAFYIILFYCISKCYVNIALIENDLPYTNMSCIALKTISNNHSMYSNETFFFTFYINRDHACFNSFQKCVSAWKKCSYAV